MKKFVIILFAAAAMSAMAADTAVKGFLVDISCAEDEGQNPGFGAAHSRHCLLMKDCEESGYGVLTSDKKVIRFDKAGNDAAKKFIAGVTRESDIRVTVTGSVSGDQMTVSKIELQ